MTELLRFFTVTVLGVVIDLAIAFGLHTGLGVPLWLAAAIGFTVAASANYVIHQTWSFQSGPRSLSARRAGLYAMVALATLAVRVALVALLDRVLADDLALVILICGAGGSFFVNFALSKFVVFAAAPDTP
ncbi:GtrA family protein [Erythrobacter dokdonensis]|uniref:Putative membrane protein n=1 Tax=Erythrobacter dokdonensis DSW-74 TaxID=1300349 RepID=A0A1A7BCX0_9SPHN|nr:GtrA family protein [Erythrobacter dokdonensis]OBV10334.1 putative membrane protein [Erythrobacter dokdonensis DSW-74]